MTALSFLAAQPGFTVRVDRCPYDRRVTHVCGGIYQKTETWVCIEVSQ